MLWSHQTHHRPLKGSSASLSVRRANIVVQCESWWNLAKQFASRSPPLHLLSSSVQRTLMKALVLGGFAHMDSDTKQQYWAEVTQAYRCTVKNKSVTWFIN